MLFPDWPFQADSFKRRSGKPAFPHAQTGIEGPKTAPCNDLSHFPSARGNTQIDTRIGKRDTAQGSFRVERYSCGHLFRYDDRRAISLMNRLDHVPVLVPIPIVPNLQYS